MTTEPPPDMHLTRSSRDQVAMAATLTPWIAGQLPAGADPEVVLSGASDANGMSSETLLFEAQAMAHRYAAASEGSSPDFREGPELRPYTSAWSASHTDRRV